jgi:hypothetical protein
LVTRHRSLSSRRWTKNEGLDVRRNRSRSSTSPSDLRYTDTAGPEMRGLLISVVEVRGGELPGGLIWSTHGHRKGSIIEQTDPRPVTRIRCPFFPTRTRLLYGGHAHGDPGPSGPGGNKSIREGLDRREAEGRPGSEAGARRQVRGSQESWRASARGGRAGETAATAAAEGREEITEGNLGRAGPMRSPQRARETVLGVGNPLDAQTWMICPEVVD